MCSFFSLFIFLLGFMYYQADDGIHGPELWRDNGGKNYYFSLPICIVLFFVLIYFFHIYIIIVNFLLLFFLFSFFPVLSTSFNTFISTYLFFLSFSPLYFSPQAQSTLPLTLPLTLLQGLHTISTPLYSRIWFQGPQAPLLLISRHITATSTSPPVALTRTGWYRTNTETIVVRIDKVCLTLMCSMRLQRTRTGMCTVLTIVL